MCIFILCNMFVPNHVILSHSLTRIITLFDLTLLHWFEMFRTLPVSLSLCYFQQVPRMEPKGQLDAILKVIFIHSFLNCTVKVILIHCAPFSMHLCHRLQNLNQNALGSGSPFVVILLLILDLLLLGLLEFLG